MPSGCAVPSQLKSNLEAETKDPVCLGPLASAIGHSPGLQPTLDEINPSTGQGVTDLTPGAAGALMRFFLCLCAQRAPGQPLQPRDGHFANGRAAAVGMAGQGRAIGWELAVFVAVLATALGCPIRRGENTGSDGQGGFQQVSDNQQDTVSWCCGTPPSRLASQPRPRDGRNLTIPDLGQGK